MSVGHYIERCEHGTVGGQCRCPSKDKEIRRIPCPSNCPQRSTAPLSGDAFGFLDLQDVASANIVYCPDCKGILKFRPVRLPLRLNMMPDPTCEHRNAHFYVRRHNDSHSDS